MSAPTAGRIVHYTIATDESVVCRAAIVMMDPVHTENGDETSVFVPGIGETVADCCRYLVLEGAAGDAETWHWPERTEAPAAPPPSSGDAPTERVDGE